MTGRDRYLARRKAWRMSHRYANHGQFMIVRDAEGDTSYIAIMRFYATPRRTFATWT